MLPYNWIANGNVMVVMQSSQWLPVSVVPGTIVPVPVVIVIGLQGVKVAVGVGVGVGVKVAVGVGVRVGVGLAVAVAVGDGLAVGVGVGVPPAGAWIATMVGDPVLKYPTVALTPCGG